MRKCTLKELRALVRDGLAQDITTATDDEMWELRLLEGRFATIAMSFGVYGMTGALLKGENFGGYYAITARNANLFRYC